MQSSSSRRRATTTRTVSSSKRSPQEAMGKALSQSPGAVAAKNVAFWRGSLRTDSILPLMATIPGLSQAVCLWEDGAVGGAQKLDDHDVMYESTRESSVWQ